MDCETATPLIEALCDDELDVATAARLVAHLDGCAACAALRREAETRQSALREARPVDRLPDGVRARLVREVGRTAPARRKVTWRVPAALAAAGLLAGGLAAGFALLTPAPPRAPALADQPVVTELTGEVFCLRCALAQLFPDTAVLDERHLPVLRTDEGEVVTLLDGAVTRAALSRKGCAGRRVALTVRLFPSQEIAEVLSVRALGPSSGPPDRDVVAAAAARAAPPPR
jgi:hypothetical protein